MPIDKNQLKRVSNLLNQLQVRTALESTNVSPQYLQREVERRDTKRLENAGNKIDPVTKKPYKYSEKWLQSTGQQIPSLDTEGTSAMNALDLIGLPGAVKIAGTIGREGIKRGIGRVATNLISTSSENISSSLSGMRLKSAIKAIIKDKPLYSQDIDEVPYRMMFGLKPRQYMQYFDETIDEFVNPMDYFKTNPDGSLRFAENTSSYNTIKDNMLANRTPREYVLGHYKQVGNRYWDKWDVGLNPGELKRNLKAIINQKTPEDIYNLNSISTQHYNSIPTFQPDKVINSVGEVDKFKLATEKTKSILRLLERAAVRKTVDMFTDPVVIQGTIKGIR